MLLNVIHVSTNRERSDERDKSIHPLDVIDGPDSGNDARVVDGSAEDDMKLGVAANYDISLDCLDPLPGGYDEDLVACSGASGSVGVEGVHHETFQSRRRNGHDIIILVDQSGSTMGLVDKDSLKESDNPAISGTFGDLASDAAGYRIAAVKQFIGQLNAEDRIGVVTFGDNGTLTSPCFGASEGWPADLENCFGINRDFWMPPHTAGSLAGLDSLIGEAKGRANLWEAVHESYRFLNNRFDDPTFVNRARNENATAPPTKHIVVITDGPDTCARGEAQNDCESVCSTVGFEDMMALLDETQLKAETDASVVPIQIHFVQFESRGYQGRDARQMEAACVSGGHYQYVNSNLFPFANTQAFISSLEVAMLNVRLSLMGYWGIALDIPYLAEDAGGMLGSPPGQLYGASGVIQLESTANVLAQDKPFPFGVGQGEGAPAATVWDRRPTVRKPCNAASQCGADGTAGDCTIYCSTETMICPKGNTGTQANDGITQCSVSGTGETGWCCEGACLPAGTECTACSQ